MYFWEKSYIPLCEKNLEGGNGFFRKTGNGTVFENYNGEKALWRHRGVEQETKREMRRRDSRRTRGRNKLVRVSGKKVGWAIGDVLMW